MTAIEIAVICFISLFTIVVILLCLGFDFKKALKWLFTSKEKKEKPEKKKKEKQPKQKKKIVKEKTTKVDKKETKDESKQDSTEKTSEPEKKPKAFSITKKGVARIHKKAIERDSRTGAIIEQAIKPKEKTQEFNESSDGYQNFDDLLNKLKDIGDPDELDDDTFKKLFLPKNADTNDAFSDDELDDILADDGFISSESPATGKIDRRLKHYTIDGSHLNLDKKYDDYPSRMPILDMEHLVFKDRITGRYDNIKMGDVSNILKPPEDEETKENQSNEVEDSDEEIFARIMERRRRELGIDSQTPKTENKESKDDFNISDLVIADAIMNPRFKKNRNK